MKINSQKMLLIDGLGALISFVFLGILLPLFHEAIGMPIDKLYFLAGIALLFAFFSLGSFWRLKKDWSKFLKFISVMNFSYSLMTTGLLVFYFDRMGILGKIYFIAEIPIVFALAIVEWKISSRK